MLRSLISILVLIGLALGGFRYWQSEIEAPLIISSPRLYTVEPGENAYGVLSDLRTQGLTTVRESFAKIWIKFVFSPQSIKAGTYELTSGITLPELFSKLQRGEEKLFSITLVEGQTWQQWRAVLALEPTLHNDINDDVIDSLLAQWEAFSGAEVTSLEGLLLADTYAFTVDTKVSVILQKSLQAMIDFLQLHWKSRPPTLPYNTYYEALTLASIIEKETALASERDLIAGVFINRLHENMRLQTDPTVIYGLGDEFDGNLTRKHLRQATPYNTYVIKGLPPSPIAMAGKPAIMAALQPRFTEALYFVARGDGSHQFSTTLAEHNKAVQKYQIKK